MLGAAERRRSEDWRSQLAKSGAFALTLAVAVVVSLFGRADRIDTTSLVLGVAAVVAGLLVAGERDGLSVSGSFLVYVLAGALLGPRSAIIAAVVAELAAASRLRTRPSTIVRCNLPSAVIPAAIAAVLITAIAPGSHHRPIFFIAIGISALVAITLSFAIVAGYRRLVLPQLPQFGLRAYLDDVPSIVLNLLVVVAGGALAVKLGIGGLAFALSGVLTFAYMAHLVERARRRSQQYVSLSWGVLAGLIRSLDVRDQRAGRHAAAVAAFSRDIARAVGMSDAEVELAHTAGLLHDLGHFALSDRVAERDRPLTAEDWAAIQLHPAIGADLLRDLGVYGPVAEIVKAHHERPDGRGYPEGLTADQIPEIAKIIAVAEVYDTLTAKDTYRVRHGSFEAIRELRRVAGTQLDERYVEVLSELLSGEGLEYRHADQASFDVELDMPRRVREATGGPSI
jgi:putative nucleotidyltransferase with HDIG domain